jgi:hypothetical protein
MSPTFIGSGYLLDFCAVSKSPALLKRTEVRNFFPLRYKAR